LFRSENLFSHYLIDQPSNEIPQAANRVVDVLGLGLCAADCVVGAELMAVGYDLAAAHNQTWRRNEFK